MKACIETRHARPKPMVGGVKERTGFLVSQASGSIYGTMMKDARMAHMSGSTAFALK
jgi:hypothetical protein